MHWYKRDPHAAIEGMLGLTMEERGAYNTLLDLLYARNGVVPNDDRFMAVAQQCRPQQWRRVRDALIAKGKVRIKPDGKLTANSVETRMTEAQNFSESQSLKAKKRWKSTTEAMPRGNAYTTTSTKNLSCFGTTSELTTEVPPAVDNPAPLKRATGWEPSTELLTHEAQKRPAPGSLATALLDGALTRPAIAPTQPAKSGGNLERPFSRAEAGKLNGWDFGPKKAAGQ